MTDDELIRRRTEKNHMTNLHSPWANVLPTGPLMAPKEAAQYLGCGKTHFYALVAKGRLPKPLRLGAGHNGATVVPKPWLDAVIASRFNAEEQ